MDKRTQKITTGAACIAIFAIMLLLNRQTGSFFEEILVYLFPIPMVAFSAQYGWKSSLPVLVGMAFFSILFGTFTTIFYAVSEALIGLVFGDCIYRRADMTKTLFLIMIMSALVNVLNTIVLADLFGMNLQLEIAEMQTMMDKIFAQANVVPPEGMISDNYLLQMLVISMVFFGIVQGFLIYEITLLVLKRLRFNVEKPQSIYSIYPPKWTGYLAFAAFAGYNMTVMNPLQNDFLQNLLQVAGICGNLYLMAFGFIGIIYFVRMKLRIPKFAAVFVCLACFIIMSIMVIMVGLIYISTDYHRMLAEENAKRMLSEKDIEEKRANL